MLARLLTSADIWSGLLCAAFGVFFITASIGYDFGSAMAMGPGYFPIWLASGLVAFGALLVIKGLAGEPERMSQSAWAPALIVLGGIAVFAVLQERAGFFVAGFLLVLIGSLATASFRRVELAVFAVGLVLFVALVFVYGLGLAIPLWPTFGEAGPEAAFGGA